MKSLSFWVACLLTLLAVVPYLKDVTAGRTRPNIVSWGVWTTLTSVAALAQLSGGEYRAGAFSVAASVETLAVVVLALRYGYARWSLFDGVCLVGVFTSFLVWRVSASPTAGLVVVVVVDMFAALPTFRHSYLAPFEETYLTFATASVAGLFALIGLEQYTALGVLYPAYIVLVNALLTVVTMIRQAVVRGSLPCQGEARPFDE